MPAEPSTLDADNELIERIGLQMGVHGLGRLEGRICAAMVLHPEPRITMGELVERLGAAKSYVSTSLRRLIELGWVERVPLFGSRRDAYELLPLGISSTHERSMTEMSRLLGLLEEGIKSRPPGTVPNAKLAEYRDFMATMLDEFPAYMARIFDRMERGDVPPMPGGSVRRDARDLRS